MNNAHNNHSNDVYTYDMKARYIEYRIVGPIPLGTRHETCRNHSFYTPACRRQARGMLHFAVVLRAYIYVRM